jgi:hypothetical protein
LKNIAKLKAQSFNRTQMTRILRIFTNEEVGAHAAQAPALRVALMVSGANPIKYPRRSIKSASSVSYN